MEAYEDALEKLEQEKYKTNGELKKKVELKNQPLSGCGTSYYLENDKLQQREADFYTSVFKLDPSTQTYKLVTLYPVAQ